MSRVSLARSSLRSLSSLFQYLFSPLLILSRPPHRSAHFLNKTLQTNLSPSMYTYPSSLCRRTSWRGLLGRLHCGEGWVSSSFRVMVGAVGVVREVLAVLSSCPLLLKEVYLLGYLGAALGLC